MEVERMQDRAQGRVWSGAAALQQGLVDAIGGVPRAIAIAKQAAKIGGELCAGFAGWYCAWQASRQAFGLSWSGRAILERAIVESIAVRSAAAVACRLQIDDAASAASTA